jgi:serine/threonine protein kinase
VAKLPAVRTRLASITKLVLSESVKWGVMTLVKTAVSFFQLVLICMDMYDIPLSSTARRFFAAFSVVNIDLFQLLRVECIAKFDFYQTSAAFAAAVIVVEVIAFVCAGCRQWKKNASLGGRKGSQRWETVLVGALLFCYSPVSAQVFKTFTCTQISSKSFLSADLDLECSTSAHSSAVGFAVFAVLMISIGLPLFHFYSVYKHHQQAFQHEGDYTLRALGSGLSIYNVVNSDYTFDMWFWDCIDLAKQFLLICIGALLPRGSVVQIAVAVFIMFAYVALLMLYLPYRQHQTFGLLANMLLLCTLYLGMLLKIKSQMDTGSGIQESVESGKSTGLFDGFSVELIESILIVGASVVFLVFFVKILRFALHIALKRRSLHEFNQQLEHKSIVLFDSEFDDCLVDYEDITILEAIGIGAAGTVSRAKWKGKEIAVKVVSLSLLVLNPFTSSGAMGEQLEEVKNEARILSGVRHANIVHFYGVAFNHSSIELQLLILLELCTHSLKDEIEVATAEGKSLTWNQKLRYLLDIARGMQCLHERNILHRDLKPGNCLMASSEKDGYSSVKVADFGTSKITPTDSRSSTMTSNIGTPIYMAPELMTMERRLDKVDTAEAVRVDVYSFGVTMFSVCAQAKPYAEPTFAQLNMWTLRDRIVGGYRPSIPLATLASAPYVAISLMKKCWHKDPASRPASFREISAALRDCMEAVEQLAEKEVVDTRFNTSMIKMRTLTMSKRTPFKCSTATSVDADSAQAAKDAYRQIKEKFSGSPPTVIIMHCTCTHDVEQVAKTLHKLAPSSLICGGTSCSTVMSGTTSHRDSHTALALFAITDPDGHYALAAGKSSSTQEAERSCRSQIDSLPAHTANEDKIPSLVLSILSVGTEESVLKGVEKALGPVPVFGGSSADNNMDASWRQVSAAATTPTVTQHGFSLLLMWPSVETFVRLTSLHKKTGREGTVTGVAKDNPRKIMTIDGRPATEVYNDWTSGAIGDELALNEWDVSNITANTGGRDEMPPKLVGNVLAASTNFPLGLIRPGNNSHQSE